MTISLAAVLDVVFGIAFGITDHVGIWSGLYFATVTATTVGYGDVIPVGWLPHLLSVGMMLTVIPLVTATFSLFTSGLTGINVHEAKNELKEYVEKRLKHHLGKDA